MKLNVKDIVGNDHCIVRADGQKIYDHIHTTLQGGEDVTLDFAGIDQYALPFLYCAIGELFQDIDEEVLESKLHFENMSSNMVECVKENAARHYRYLMEHNKLNVRAEVIDIRQVLDIVRYIQTSKFRQEHRFIRKEKISTQEHEAFKSFQERHFNYLQKDKIFVDTNVWGYLLVDDYLTVNEYQNRRYDKYKEYIEKATEHDAKLQYSGLVVMELIRLIEKKSHERYTKIGTEVYKKQYRHNNPAERELVLKTVHGVLESLPIYATLLNSEIGNEAISDIRDIIGTAEIDGYDALIVATMKANGITNIITDDMDFATVDGIRVFTANQNTIRYAREQNKLYRLTGTLQAM